MRLRTDPIARPLFLVPVLLFCVAAASARQGISPVDTTGFPAVSVRDSGQVVHLLHADLLIGIQPKGKDSTQWQKLVGNVVLQQGETTFSCDSALQNLNLNTMDAYGHIHINQADSIHTYADFLHYEANTRMATLKNNVRLTDGQMVLTTNLLHYDMNVHIGDYLQGGKLVNQQTVLTSERGYYFADTKDVYFKSNVQLTDPEYTLATDSLQYNSRTHIATFVAPTTINTGQAIIHTSCGHYDTDHDSAHLCDRAVIVDSAQTLTADSMDYDKNTGIGIGVGNVVWTDTSRHMTLLAGYARSNQATQTVLATLKPLMIIDKEKDTLYITADTLTAGPIPGQDHPPDTLGADTLRPGGARRAAQDSAGPPAATAAPSPAADSLPAAAAPPGDTLPPAVDSVRKPLRGVPEDTARVRPDSTTVLGAQEQLADSLNRIRVLAMPAIDSVPAYHPRDSALPVPHPSPAVEQAPGDSSRQRYIKGFHHVRLFSDSLQGVADSLYYADTDSAFRFYGDPVLWTGVTQLTGDTISLYTRNQEPERLVLQPHGLIINRMEPGLFNQVKGNIITGYFREGQLDWMHIDGNAESLYYIQDDDGRFVGANRSTSAAIDLYFKDGTLYKVVLRKEADGSFLQPNRVPVEDKELRGFRWEEDRRPKFKTDLMQ